MSHVRSMLHGVAAVPWGLWIASVAAFAGLGTFLDEYYVGNKTRTKVRERISGVLQRIEGSGKQFRENVGAFWIWIGVLAWGVVCIGSLYWYPMLLRMRLDLIRKHTMLGILALPVFLLDIVETAFGIILALLFTATSLWCLLELTFNFCKLVLWTVFRPAAEPQRSPFKFFTGMVGLWVLIGKLLTELTKGR